MKYLEKTRLGLLYGATWYYYHDGYGDGGFDNDPGGLCFCAFLFR